MRVDKKLLEIRAKFRDFYNRELRDDYKEFESVRKKRLLLFILILIGGVFLYTILRNFFYRDDFLSSSEGNFLSIFSSVILLGLVFIYRNYSRTIKNLVMDKILSFFGDIKYGGTGVSSFDIKSSDLFSNYESFNQYTDDNFYGSYNGVNLSISEQKLVIDNYNYTRSNQIRNKKDVIFSGFFVLLEFDKKFNGKTVCFDKKILSYYWLFVLFFICGSGMSIYASLGDKDFIKMISFFVLSVLVFFVYHIVKYKTGRKSDVNLEDVVFSKKWKVMATDQIEARYLLTPAFMERMLKVKKLFRSRNIEFSFFDNKLLIAIHTNKNMFETANLFHSALSYHKMQDVVHQFYSIFSIIDILKIKGDE